MNIQRQKIAQSKKRNNQAILPAQTSRQKGHLSERWPWAGYNTDRAGEILCWNGRTCLGINNSFTDLASLGEWLEGKHFWGRPTLSHAWGLLEAMWQNLKPFERKCFGLLSCGLKRKCYAWNQLNTPTHWKKETVQWKEPNTGKSFWRTCFSQHAIYI